MLGVSPTSGAGSCAGLRARFPLPSARPGVGGRTREHPAPCARHPLPLAENNRSRAPSRLPSRREPNFLYLGRGGGLYVKGALRGAPSQVQAGPGRSTEAGPSPSPLRPGRQPSVAGTSGPGRTLQLPQDGTPAPALRLLPAGCSGCSTRRSVASWRGPLPSCSIQGPLGLAVLGVLICFPVLRADSRSAIAAFLYPLQKAGKSRYSRRKMIP